MRDLVPVLLSLGLVACEGRTLAGDSSTEGDTTGASTTGGSTSTATATSEETLTTGGATKTTGEISGTGTTEGVETTGTGTGTDASTGIWPLPEDCNGVDMPNDSCPEGHKCTIEGAVSDTHCVPVVEEPKGLYEPCSILMGDAMSGYDDCGPELLCWNVDPDTGIGECIGFCLGPADELSCADPGASCSICQECAVGLCLPGCDPLAQDCKGDDLCVPNPQDPGHFVCVLDASGAEGQVFDPCEYVNACDPGLHCAESKLAEECDPMVVGCCLPFCDTSMPVCPGAGQMCLSWYEEGMAPPGYEEVGLCALPQ